MIVQLALCCMHTHECIKELYTKIKSVSIHWGQCFSNRNSFSNCTSEKPVSLSALMTLTLLIMSSSGSDHGVQVQTDSVSTNSSTCGIHSWRLAAGLEQGRMVFHLFLLCSFHSCVDFYILSSGQVSADVISCQFFSLGLGYFRPFQLSAGFSTDPCISSLRIYVVKLFFTVQNK